MKPIYSVILTTVLLIISSCSLNLVEKRKHLSGYHWRGGKEIFHVKKAYDYKVEKTSAHNISEEAVQPKLGENESKEINEDLILSDSKDSLAKINDFESDDLKNVEHKKSHNSKSIISKTTRKPKGELKKTDATIAYSLLGISALISAIGFSYLIKNKSKAKTMSFWALYNKKKARILIVVLQSASALIAYGMGHLTKDVGVELPKAIDLALYSAGAASMLLYPFKKGQKSYFKQKFTDGILVFVGFGLMFNLGNQQKLSVNNAKNYKNNIEQVDVHHNNHKIDKNGIVFVAKIALLVLLFCVFLVIASLIAYLSCALMCSGYPILGLTLFFGSTFSLLFAYIIIARRIIHSKKESKKSKLFWIFYGLTNLSLLALLLFALNIGPLTIVFSGLAFLFLLLSILTKPLDHLA